MTRSDPVIVPMIPPRSSTTGPSDPNRWIEAVTLISILIALFVFGTVQQERLERNATIERNV